MTLPAESQPDAATDRSTVGSKLDGDPTSTDQLPAVPEQLGPAVPERQGLSSPAALVAVVAVGALVLIGCVLGAALTGLFGDLSASPAAVRTAAATGPDLRREPVVSFGDGKWLVAKDVRPGTYGSTVPPSSAGCSWERNASTDGTVSSVLDSGVEQPGTTVAVTIKATDAIFQSLGCGTWHRVGD